ncbi:hypothetical protein ACU686_05045 [Yinghuangia aomiensis]
MSTCPSCWEKRPSNQTWTIFGSNAVQRRPFGVLNALDLRVINDTDARRALWEASLPADLHVRSDAGRRAAPPLAGLPRLGPHERDPTASEADFDWHVGYLVEELGFLSRNSERPAVAVAPKARETVRILTSLPELGGAVALLPGAGDSTVLRAFTARMTEVVTQIVGEPLVREFGRNVQRFLGDDVPSRRRVNALVGTHGGAFALPALPRPAALHIAEPPSRHPADRTPTSNGARLWRCTT